MTKDLPYISKYWHDKLLKYALAKKKIPTLFLKLNQPGELDLEFKKDFDEFLKLAEDVFSKSN